MRARRNADAWRHFVQVPSGKADFTSVSRRTSLRLVGSILTGASLLTQTRLGIAQQLPKAVQKRLAAGKAVAWFNDRDDGLSTRGRIIADTTEKLKEAIEADENIMFTIGRGLTKKKRACQVWIFSDEFYVFPLTNQQEALVDIGENSLRTWTSPSQKDSTAFPLAADLQSLKINNEQGLKGSAQITGSVTSRRLTDVRANYAFRLTFRGDDFTTRKWTYLEEDQMPTEGIFDFSFSEVNPHDEKKPFVGPTVMFLTLVTVEGPQQHQVNVLHSNTAATMVNVLAG
jgi:hypothetical protein